MKNKYEGKKFKLNEQKIVNDITADPIILVKECKGELAKELDKASTIYTNLVEKAISNANKRHKELK